MSMTFHSGLTTVRVDDKGFINIEHRGNMGNTIDDVSANLNRINLIGIEEMKAFADSLNVPYEESGSPDYIYTFKMKVGV